MKEPKWLLDSTPREVQLEALRRSYLGYSLKDTKDSEPIYRPFSNHPQVGWGHYLEMRLGKTPLSLNEMELFRRDYGVKNSIVVCPNSFKQGWVDESLKSGASVPWFVLESGKIEKLKTELKQATSGFGLAVNYEAIRSDKTKQLLLDIMKSPTGMYFDESIKMKTHSSQQTKAGLLLAKEAEYVRNLSGLPMTQGPHDLYAQFRAIRRFSGKNYFSFRARYCKMGGFKNKAVVGSKNEEELQEKLRESSFLAKRRDWANPLVPEYFQEHLEMTAKQKKHYEEIDRDFMTLLESGEAVTVEVVVSKLQKLQQISSGFLYNEGQTHPFEDPRKTPKISKLLDMMEETNGKIIVCYHYSFSGDVLQEVLRPFNPATIRGNAWMKRNGVNVESEKKRFNQDKSCRVMILQISAGKYGHDLSGVDGDRCGTMVFYETTYSLDDRTQVEMRNTSAFQDWTNTYHDFVSSKVEKNATAALARKSDLAQAIIDFYKMD